MAARLDLAPTSRITKPTVLIAVTARVAAHAWTAAAASCTATVALVSRTRVSISLRAALAAAMHDLSAGWLASPAPNGLTAHGNRFGLFTRFGHKGIKHLHRNVLLGEALNRLHETFFVQAHQADGLPSAPARPVRPMRCT
jgi:hypothetical protein